MKRRITILINEYNTKISKRRLFNLLSLIKGVTLDYYYTHKRSFLYVTNNSIKNSDLKTVAKKLTKAGIDIDVQESTLTITITLYNKNGSAKKS